MVYRNGQIVKHKLFIYLGLVINGASWRQLLPNLDLVTGIQRYNQLLNLINESREQNRMT